MQAIDIQDLVGNPKKETDIIHRHIINLVHVFEPQNLVRHRGRQPVQERFNNITDGERVTCRMKLRDASTPPSDKLLDTRTALKITQFSIKGRARSVAMDTIRFTKNHIYRPRSTRRSNVVIIIRWQDGTNCCM